jgi:hypothetical protein
MVAPFEACPNTLVSPTPFITARATAVNDVGNDPDPVVFGVTDTVPHWIIAPFGNLVHPFDERLCVYPVVPAVSIQISPAAEAVGVEPVTKT